MSVDRRTLIRIAHWYYEVGLTQEEIGKRLQMSRQKINQIVNTLIKDGIVTITINGQSEDVIPLENEIERVFQIPHAIVANVDDSSMPLLQALGVKAAEFLDGFIKDGNKIGISWGLTIGETVNAMRQSSKGKCQVVQLVGGLNAGNHMIRPDEIVKMLASKLKCNYKSLYAPATFTNNMAKSLMLQEESIATVLESTKHCDIAIMGIGELGKSATVMRHGYITEAQLARLQGCGYVGDVCFNHFDINGNWELGEFNQLKLGISHEALKATPNVIAIAGGLDKVSAIIGALHTRSIDTLITDSITARAILKTRANQVLTL